MTPRELNTFISLAKLRKYSVDDLAEALRANDVTQPDEFETFPIHEIATANVPLIDLIVSLGADPNVRNGQGYTALDIAVARKGIDNVAALLRNGARHDTRDRYGNGPLFTSLVSGSYCVEITGLLLDHGADPDATNANGLSARAIMIERDHPLLARIS